MKKVHFLYLVSLLLPFWSCNNEMMGLDAPINTDASTRALEMVRMICWDMVMMQLPVHLRDPTMEDQELLT